MSWIEKCMALEGEDILILTNSVNLSSKFINQIRNPKSLETYELSDEDLNNPLSPQIHEKIRDAGIIITVLQGDYDFFRTNIGFRIDILKTMRSDSLARWAHLIGIDEESLRVIESTDYDQLNDFGAQLGEAIANSKKIEVRDELSGTCLTIMNTGWLNPPIVESGIITGIHCYGNYPAGEVCIIMDRGTKTSPVVSGEFTADASISGRLLKEEPVTVKIKDNIVTHIGGGRTAQKLETFFAEMEKNLPQSVAQKVREVGEIGFGTNPLASFRGVFLEDEKVFGSVHISVGTNVHLKGMNDVASREILCNSRSTLACDGITIIERSNPKRRNLRRKSHMNYFKYPTQEIFDDSLVINKGNGLACLKKDKLYRQWPMHNEDFRFAQIGDYETSRIAARTWKAVVNSRSYLTPKDIAEMISPSDVRIVEHVLSCMESYGIIEIQNPHTLQRERELMLETAKNALSIILGIKPGERVLIISDRSARRIIDSFIDAATDMGITKVDRYEIKEEDRPLKAVPLDLEKLIPDYDVFINILEENEHETPFRVSLVVGHELKYGRVGHGPGFNIEMMTRGPMSTDYTVIAEKAENLIEKLQNATEIEIMAPSGTRLIFSVEGRTFMTDVTIGDKEIGNFPMGEVYVAPVEDSAHGVVVIDGSIGDVGYMPCPLALVIENGKISAIECNRKRLKRKIEKLLSIDEEASIIGEFGIGLNPGARPSGHTLLDEKAGRTAHVAFGNNVGFKSPGKNNSKTHRDFIFMNPTIIATYRNAYRRIIMRRGEVID